MIFMFNVIVKYCVNIKKSSRNAFIAKSFFYMKVKQMGKIKNQVPKLTLATLWESDKNLEISLTREPNFLFPPQVEVGAYFPFQF